MKICAYLVLAMLLVGANLRFIEHESQDVTLLSIAINEIIEKVAIESNRIDIRVFGTDRGLPEIDEILAGNKKIPVEVKKIRKGEMLELKSEYEYPDARSVFYINESAILLVESIDFLVYIDNYHFLPREFYKPLKIYVYLRGLTFHLLE